MRSDLIEAPDELIDVVLTAATEGHRELGPGLLESVYEAALMCELSGRDIQAQRQVPVYAMYKCQRLGLGFRADIIVRNCLLLELKAATTLTDIDLAQVISYLKILGFKRGYLLNFHEKGLKDGIKRVSI